MSQSPVFRGTFKGGYLFYPDPDCRDRYVAQLAKFRGKMVAVTVKAPTSQRSLDQNAYIWGVAYPIIAEAVGYDKHEVNDPKVIEQIHYALVERCFGTSWNAKLRVTVPNKRSSKLSTVEFSEYMEWLVRHAAEQYGIVVPLPGESEAMGERQMTR